MAKKNEAETGLTRGVTAGTSPIALAHSAFAHGAVNAENMAPDGEPFEGRYVTCDCCAEPHLWIPDCAGVIQLVPEPGTDDVQRCLHGKSQDEDCVQCVIDSQADDDAPVPACPFCGKPVSAHREVIQQGTVVARLCNKSDVAHHRAFAPPHLRELTADEAARKIMERSDAPDLRGKSFWDPSREFAAPQQVHEAGLRPNGERLNPFVRDLIVAARAVDENITAELRSVSPALRVLHEAVVPFAAWKDDREQ
jgi:hypothetical protein